MKWSRSVVSNSLRPMDCSPPSSSVRGILQARMLEWVAISFSRGSSRPRDLTQVSHIAGRRFNLWAMKRTIPPVALLMVRSKNLWSWGYMGNLYLLLNLVAKLKLLLNILSFRTKRTSGGAHSKQEVFILTSGLGKYGSFQCFLLWEDVLTIWSNSASSGGK